MKAVDDALLNRVERNEKIRALKAHEDAAADLRSDLGLLTREKYVTIDPIDAAAVNAADGVTRMRTDQIDRLYNAGKLSPDQRAAALKIRTVWEAMSRGLFPGGAFGGIVGTKSRGSFRHPLERMSGKEFFIWAKEYKPWANGKSAKTALRRETRIDGRKDEFRKTFVQVCYHVVVDNYGPAQLERMWPISRGNGVIVLALQRGLSNWKHLEYDPEENLEDLRAEILSEARARIESVHPRTRPLDRHAV